MKIHYGKYKKPFMKNGKMIRWVAWIVSPNGENIKIAETSTKSQLIKAIKYYSKV